jgi:hypothetical protein
MKLSGFPLSASFPLSHSRQLFDLVHICYFFLFRNQVTRLINSCCWRWIFFVFMLSSLAHASLPLPCHQTHQDLTSLIEWTRLRHKIKTRVGIWETDESLSSSLIVRLSKIPTKSLPKNLLVLLLILKTYRGDPMTTSLAHLPQTTCAKILPPPTEREKKRSVKP